MKQVTQILDWLQANGPATSTAIADSTGLGRSSVKIGLHSLHKRQMIDRTLTERTGKGPRQMFLYSVKSDADQG
jgi:predicted transcriptional regulator